MNFLKSVLSEPTPTPSPSPSPSPSPPSSPTSPPPDPETTAHPTSSWAFGSTLFKAIASKSESLIDNYYKDLQQFSSGLKEETSVFRQAASRAVQELPARFETGAAIAQESLEAVGQAIDNVTEIIGKELKLASDDGFMISRMYGSDDSAPSSEYRDKDSTFTASNKPYSRLEAVIRGLQCDVSTYAEEVSDGGYSEWKMKFRVDERREEIEGLFKENGVIKEIHDEVVPETVDDETFWYRYFYRVEKVVKAEEARAMIVKRAISRDEDEELSWDIEDDVDNNGSDDRGNRGYEMKDELRRDVDSKGKEVMNSQVESGEARVQRDLDDAGVSSTKANVLADEENVGQRLSCSEKDGSEGKIGSDISIISSRRSSAEDDMGWDEIDDIPSGDESKLESHGAFKPHTVNDVSKRLSSAEEDEVLGWGIEDEDEPDKK